jgi:hypothetical protein
MVAKKINKIVMSKKNKASRLRKAKKRTRNKTTLFYQRCTRCGCNKDTKRPTIEDHLLQSFKSQGYLASDLLNLSIEIDLKPKFNEYLKIILRGDAS